MFCLARIDGFTGEPQYFRGRITDKPSEQWQSHELTTMRVEATEASLHACVNYLRKTPDGDPSRHITSRFANSRRGGRFQNTESARSRWMHNRSPYLLRHPSGLFLTVANDFRPLCRTTQLYETRGGARRDAARANELGSLTSYTVQSLAVVIRNEMHDRLRADNEDRRRRHVDEPTYVVVADGAKNFPNTYVDYNGTTCFHEHVHKWSSQRIAERVCDLWNLRSPPPNTVAAFEVLVIPMQDRPEFWWPLGHTPATGSHAPDSDYALSNVATGSRIYVKHERDSYHVLFVYKGCYVCIPHYLVGVEQNQFGERYYGEKLAREIKTFTDTDLRLAYNPSDTILAPRRSIILES